MHSSSGGGGELGDPSLLPLPPSKKGATSFASHRALLGHISGSATAQYIHSTAQLMCISIDKNTEKLVG